MWLRQMPETDQDARRTQEVSAVSSWRWQSDHFLILVAVSMHRHPGRPSSGDMAIVGGDSSCLPL